MSNGSFPVAVPQQTIIATRIGPIFDPKFLNLIPEDRFKDIVIIQLQAQIRAMEEEVRAVEQIVEVVKETKLAKS